MQVKSVYKSVTGGDISLEFDTGELGDQTVVEVWVKSSETTSFLFYGSRNGTEWRLSDTIPVAVNEVLRGYQNAYRYLKVECAAIGDHEIEIVTNGA